MGRPSVTQVEKNHVNSWGTPLSPLERKLLGVGIQTGKNDCQGADIFWNLKIINN